MTGAAASFDADRVLPCGTRVADLLAHLDQPDPALREHIRGCPHCTAELASLNRVWESVRRAAATPVAVPHGLAERALSTVHGLRGAGAEATVIEQERGRLRVQPSAVLTLVRQVCAELVAQRSGVHLRRCHGDARTVQVDLMVRFGLPAAEIGTELGELAEAELRATLGPAAPSVRVHIVDVAPPSGR